MAYIPNRGDIVHLDFDPATGREIKGARFGVVLSGKQFNQHGLAMICPISQGVAAASRTYGTIVTLMGAGVDTQGAVHCHQLKALDWQMRKAKFKEATPKPLFEEISARVNAILFD